MSILNSARIGPNRFESTRRPLARSLGRSVTWESRSSPTSPHSRRESHFYSPLFPSSTIPAQSSGTSPTGNPRRNDGETDSNGQFARARDGGNYLHLPTRGTSLRSSEHTIRCHVAWSVRCDADKILQRCSLEIAFRQLPRFHTSFARSWLMRTL